jgi:hypothetical protein
MPMWHPKKPTLNGTPPYAGAIRRFAHAHRRWSDVAPELVLNVPARLELQRRVRNVEVP